MADQPAAEPRLPDPQALSRNLAKVAERSHQLMSDFLRRQAAAGPALDDPLNLGNAFLELTRQMMSDPAKLMEAQAALWQDYLQLWQNTARSMMGETVAPLAAPERGDKRFRHEDWEQNQVFDFVKQFYLITARWMQQTTQDVEGLDAETQAKVDFYTRQFADALSPSNFALTNPEVLRAIAESDGENLVQGLDNLLRDLESGEGKLKISQTDMAAFEVGRNVGATPGKVVFQNRLLQLIQFAPSTEKVRRRPLLITPPWINKFYILDLKPENSFIKWAVDQGFTVFVVSWVNPGAEMADTSFEDYMTSGLLEAIDAVSAATGEDELTTIGYCIGGTLTAATLAYMAARGDQRVKAVTYFVSLVDFAEAGDLKVFIDEEQISQLEANMNERGFLRGDEMATTFNMLRANDLIWSFMVNNYLLGKDPMPFDLLYWNADSTRMPAAMHSYYLRNMYMKNLLCQPGGITLAGQPIDLGQIEIPSYILSAKEDHIAPWNACYKATQLYSGPSKFVLAGSGHIAGVVNPPASGKYCHWTNTKKPKSHETWLEGATCHEGSWWPDWKKWLDKQSGDKVAARVPGDGALEVIEDAPGSYVKVKG
ncbi:MAG TPA: class I poly(R)-hydroxyalkanoic acid synthase [Alphaproteobacteria bacterium]|jgi:polyhydroxyalkanoate synthase|nr:class I poly(R)-hydroxyalkanoic acid synthase [Alphaproteobacteria bacterium]MDP7428442.1 class I poly(R)-hydroxyalkanoic acid synthase [Alphaproteobacteria bacterium]HJM48819.1 class I poly(R)-hydroxyalkanoic acid synthase [Alphaproteobacteria bacterium]